MDTEAVQGVGSQLGQSAESLRQQNQQLCTVIGRLMGEWQGGSASMFESEMMALLQRVGQSADMGATLHQRLKQEVTEWLQAADILGTGLSDGIIGIENKIDGDGKTQESEFDWSKFFDDTISHSSDYFLEHGLNVLKNIPYEQYKELGRFINLELLGNSHGGWVGRMDDIGHFIKSPWVQDGVPFIFDIVSDDDFEKGNYGRAIAGEAFVHGASWLIPGVGTALMVSDAVQFGGTLVSGGLEVFGYTDQAVWLQETLEHIDLGEYVEGIGEAVYDTVEDWIQDPSEFVTDVTQVAGFIEDVGAGMVDAGGTLIDTISGWF